MSNQTFRDCIQLKPGASWQTRRGQTAAGDDRPETLVNNMLWCHAVFLQRWSKQAFDACFVWELPGSRISAVLTISMIYQWNWSRFCFCQLCRVAVLSQAINLKFVINLSEQRQSDDVTGLTDRQCCMGDICFAFQVLSCTFINVSVCVRALTGPNIYNIGCQHHILTCK